MANIGYATVSVIPSMRGFQSRLSAGMATPLKQTGAKAGADAGAAAGGRFKSSFAQGIKGLAAPLAGLLAIGKGVDIMKDAINEASALDESGNKIKVTFGAASDTINKFAQGAADSIGQSELEARNAAATFGVYGKAAGLAGEDLSSFSTKLTTLGSDLASFYDTSPEEAIGAIGSALRGEAEPLRAYGVLLDDATLRQEAMRQGLIKTTKQALTPQQKVLSAYQVILDQTADAQGDFSRTSDSLANRQRQLAADWSNMKAELGQKLLPTMEKFTGFMISDGLPAVQRMGGAVADAGRAFAALPGPVKAGAAALVAFRIAQSAFNVDPTAWARRTTGAFDAVRLRAMLAGDAYRNTRNITRSFGDSSVQVASGVGRLSASMSGLRAAATGVGGAMRRGLGGVVGMLGGPWGIALAGGAVALTHFIGKQREAEEQVRAHRDALNEQTGALTKNNREIAENALLESGALDAANRLGIRLRTVTDAALGNADAMAEVQGALRGVDGSMQLVQGAQATQGEATRQQIADAKALTDVLGDQNGTLATARREQALLREAGKLGAQSVEDNGRSQITYKEAVEKAVGAVKEQRREIFKLIEAHNEQAEAASQNRRDQVGLAQAFADAGKEAQKGKKTLNENTQAGRDNWNALLDLADQWNNSTKQVKNARGAYADMRSGFIELADEMGYSKKEARKLADRLLGIPKKTNPKVDVDGLKAAQEDLKDLRERLEALKNWRMRIAIDSSGTSAGGIQRFAGGGRVGGSGTGDNQLIAADPREWVINPKASAYYGDGFMAALNKMRVPKFAAGGKVGNSSPMPAVRGGVTVHIGQVVAHDYDDFMRQMDQRAALATVGGMD